MVIRIPSNTIFIGPANLRHMVVDSGPPSKEEMLAGDFNSPGVACGTAEASSLREHLFVRGQVEVDQVSTKTARLPGAEGYAHRHPDGAGDFGGSAEAHPEQEADYKAENRGQNKRRRPFLFADYVAHESSGVDA